MLLAIGIIFIALGLLFLLTDKKRRKNAILPIIVGLIVIYIRVFGPLKNSDEKVTEITRLDYRDVAWIMIKPSSEASHLNAMTVRRRIVIADSGSIIRICDAIRKSHTTQSYLKNPAWAGVMQVCRINKGILAFGVKKSGPATMLTIASNGEEGWRYGYLDADSLGSVLESLHVID